MRLFPQRSRLLRRARAARVAVLFACLLGLANLSFAQTAPQATAPPAISSAREAASDWINAVRSLANQLATVFPVGAPFHLNSKNISDLDPGTAAELGRELAGELQKRGLQLPADPAAPATSARAAIEVEIDFSEG